MTFPLTESGSEVCWQARWKKKADVLLIEVLKWNHGKHVRMA